MLNLFLIESQHPPQSVRHAVGVYRSILSISQDGTGTVIARCYDEAITTPDVEHIVGSKVLTAVHVLQWRMPDWRRIDVNPPPLEKL